MLGSALSSVSGALFRKGVRRGFCQDWLASQKRLNGAIGDVFPAQEALDGGLINEVVPQEHLLNRAKEIARSFTQETAQVSIALTRQMMWKMLGADHPMEAHKIDSRAVYAQGQQSDAKEGIDSFLEKRAAVYTDKPSEHMPEFYPWWDEPDYG